MTKPSIRLYALVPLLLSVTAAAQKSPCPTQAVVPNAARSSDLICLLPQVYGGGGLVGAANGGPLQNTVDHSVHFQASSLRSFGPINSEIGVQLSQLPIASPVAGFTFSAGVITPVNYFGPVLTDRAETLGANKIFLGLSYQYFNFDKADGVNLKNFGAVLTHEPEFGKCTTAALPGLYCPNDQPLYAKDFVTTQNRVDLRVHQLTMVATYGVTDKIDVSVAVPVLNVRLGIGSTAHIVNFYTPDGTTLLTNQVFSEHTFAQGAPYDASFSNSGYAFGMGDLTIRTKIAVRRAETHAFAVGVDFRLPTGDARNFLGAGTWGFRPFATVSGRKGHIAPHATIGFQGNGSTELSGDVTTDPVAKDHLPNLFTYTAGADVSIFNRLGLSADYIGEALLHGSRIQSTTYPAFDGTKYSDVATSFNTIQIASVSTGLKINPTRNLLLTVNGLFRLNQAGLHSKPAPLVGISYSF